MRVIQAALGAAVLFLSYFSYFGFLDSLPLHIWDEARVACNSQEMLARGSWLISYFDGAPDLYNTKPPLLHWVQMVFMAVFGVNDLAVRLPSALAATATGFVLIAYARRFAPGGLVQGLLAALVLATSHGFVVYHAARSADYDALLTLFTTIYAFSFYAWLQEGKRADAIVFFSALAAALLTKASAALLLCPALALYALITGKFPFLIRKPVFYMGTLAAVAPLALFYYAREQAAPGYWQAVLANDWGGRFNQVNDGHDGPWDFYLMVLTIGWRTGYVWFYPALFALGAWCIGTYRTWKSSLSFYLLICITLYMVVISLSATKLSWYTVPLYPFLAFAVSYGLYTLLSALELHAVEHGRHVSTLILGAMLLSYPVAVTLHYTIIPPAEQSDDPFEGSLLYSPAKWIKEDMRQKALPDSLTILCANYSAQVLFYARQADPAGARYKVVLRPEDVPVGKPVLLGFGTNEKVLEERMRLKLVRKDSGAALYETAPLP